MGWLSPRGRCLTFDATSSGFVRGEGVGSLALKPLADVVDGKTVRDDKHPLLGVLAGVCLNTNGRGASLGAPNGMAEQEVIAGSIRNAGIAAADVDAVEAHGTGQVLADVVEVGSLIRSHRYQDQTPLPITSGKTQVGNMMECAGLGSLLKNLLGIRWGLTVGGLHLRELNPHMDINDTPAGLLSEHLAYPRRSAFAGVMSKGYGGTNVYCVSWGTLDHERVPLRAEAGPRICFWPGGGGFLDVKDRPEKGYYIVGSWTEWSSPEAMEEEGSNVYGYTVTLGENSWEQFQILLDADTERALHPGGAKVGKETAVYGPNEGVLGASTWIIDGRCAWVEAPAPRGEADADGGQELQLEAIPVDVLDVGQPGDKYRVRLHIAGKWRSVSWEKEPQAAGGGDDAPPFECVGKYYIVSSWNGWEYQELQRDPQVKGLYYAEVTLRWGDGEFQIVRNKDFQQVLYPSAARAPSGSDVLGPDEGGEGLHWRVRGCPGESFRIELQRSLAGGEDAKSVSWRGLER
uniref:Ketosynthase family 3 (KS3) domain-containing protein n=1 Tax=Alexandrium catenella TaxID=2925 RepID=A0A7S1RUY7_ALECA